MASSLHPTSSLPGPDRRTFLWSLASFGLARGQSHKQLEMAYRFLTPEYEVEMTVQYFAKSSIDSFRFRDSLTNRVFCLSADGEENQTCLERFTGSIAIARYRFHPRFSMQVPRTLRERVLTIDRDSRMDPRPPFEKVLPLEREVASDIQAFGYSHDEPKQRASDATVLWCLLRQDLYLNDQKTAFLILHWKHTVDFINLVDVIPGDQTQFY